MKHIHSRLYFLLYFFFLCVNLPYVCCCNDSGLDIRLSIHMSYYNCQLPARLKPHFLAGSDRIHHQAVAYLWALNEVQIHREPACQPISTQGCILNDFLLNFIGMSYIHPRLGSHELIVEIH